MLLLQAGGGGFDTTIILIYGALFAVIYFFFIRPQTKKAKAQKNFIEQVEKGDNVITTGGIHGKIVRVDENAFVLEIDSNVKIKIEKSAVSMELSQGLNPNKK